MAAGFAVGGLAACDAVDGKTFVDDVPLTGTVSAVRLENGSGGVTVNGNTSGKLALHREVEYRGERPAGPTHRVENGVLILGGCGERCTARYTVDVPASIPVSGEVSSGAVNLAMVGSVKVTTSSGRIEMNGVDGTVEVETSNGRITGENIEGGPVQARTSNGDITLSPTSPMTVQAQTSNGAITLTVPPADYQVTVESNNGDKNIGVPSNPAGPYKLVLTTSNGDIVVKSPGR